MITESHIEEMLAISNIELETLYQRIKPVVRYAYAWRDCEFEPTEDRSESGAPHEIEECDLRAVSYLWNPIRAAARHDLVQTDHFICYFRYGAPALFKPSIAEVLSQARFRDLTNITHFEVRSHDLGCVNVYHEYHWAPVILYETRKHDE